MLRQLQLAAGAAALLQQRVSGPSRPQALCTCKQRVAPGRQVAPGAAALLQQRAPQAADDHRLGALAAQAGVCGQRAQVLQLRAHGTRSSIGHRPASAVEPSVQHTPGGLRNELCL